jgi:hypothetical protein
MVDILYCCNKTAEAEAAVSVNEKKWLGMHMQLQLDKLRGPPNPWLTVDILTPSNSRLHDNPAPGMMQLRNGMFLKL